MSETLVRAAEPHEPLDAEKVAYWYFRLNGFLQIENFVVHPRGRGGQRTDATCLPSGSRTVPNFCSTTLSRCPTMLLRFRSPVR
jgi:hypothetical protein